MSNRSRASRSLSLRMGVVLALVAGAPVTQTAFAADKAAPVTQMPMFEWDPTWPKPLPDTWAIGPVVGVSVDADDHIWIIQRQSAIRNNERYNALLQKPPTAECCLPAPPIMEFDQEGKLLLSFGGPGNSYDWPGSEHGMYVDPKGFVWTAGNGRGANGKQGDTQILKFSHDGKFVMAIGKKNESTGNDDKVSVRQAAAVTLDLPTNELYVADGYGNRRIVVFDADTGKFKRMWGAYGNKPEDADIGPYKPTDPPAKQFRTVHGVSISKDGLVYVADRSNDRIQVFTKAGKFLKEVFIAKNTIQAGSASGVAFSPDAKQTYMYVLDGANHRFWILDRANLTILGYFGHHGHFGGQLDVPHNMAVDSKGNVYIGETLEGRRVQRFNFKGLGPIPAAAK